MLLAADGCLMTHYRERYPWMRLLHRDKTLAHAFAYCTSCGSIFETNPIDVVNTQKTTLPNLDTHCPVCGGFARWFNGASEVPKIIRRWNWKRLWESIPQRRT